jgi:hypothetical protein
MTLTPLPGPSRPSSNRSPRRRQLVVLRRCQADRRPRLEKRPQRVRRPQLWTVKRIDSCRRSWTARRIGERGCLGVRLGVRAACLQHAALHTTHTLNTIPAKSPQCHGTVSLSAVTFGLWFWQLNPRGGKKHNSKVRSHGAARRRADRRHRKKRNKKRKERLRLSESKLPAVWAEVSSIAAVSILCCSSSSLALLPSFYLVLPFHTRWSGSMEVYTLFCPVPPFSTTAGLACCLLPAEVHFDEVSPRVEIRGLDTVDHSRTIPGAIQHPVRALDDGSKIFRALGKDPVSRSPPLSLAPLCELLNATTKQLEHIARCRIHPPKLQKNMGLYRVQERPLSPR